MGTTAASEFDFTLSSATAALPSISDTWVSAWPEERRSLPPITVR
jgi:hypothetical protein